jgi:hypothetical protein
MLDLLIPLIFTLLIGALSQLLDLLPIKEAKKKKKIQKGFKIILLILFIISSFYSGYIAINSYSLTQKEKEIGVHQKRRSDSVLRKTRQQDSIQIDSMIKVNNGLKDSVRNVHNELNNLVTSTSVLLVSQTENFSKTAKKIQKSADTLNKYLSGIEGYVYYSVAGATSGDCYFIQNNPQHYDLRNISVIVNRYRSLDSCCFNLNGLRYFNLDSSRAKSVFMLSNQTFSPGIQASGNGVKLIGGAKQKFLLRIQIGSKVYFEELIVIPGSTQYGFKVYTFKGNSREKITVLQFRTSGLFKFDWDSEFHFKIENTFLKRKL